jgi:hypothetical protein
MWGEDATEDFVETGGDTIALGGPNLQIPNEESGQLIDLDRYWATLKFDFGAFRFGRMAGGAWGLDFGNDNEDYYRARFDTKFGDLATGFIVQKNAEDDYGASGAADQDADVYYLYGNYKAEVGSFGLLGVYLNDKRNQYTDTTKYALLPYFDTQFGNFGLRGELIWETGEMDPDNNALPANPSVDIDGMTYMIEGDYTFGDWKLMAGYAFCSGLDNSGDYTIGNAWYGGIGDDWDLLLVGMDKPGLINGHAKTNGIGETTAMSGIKLAYIDLAWKAHKKLKVWATYGHVTADTVESFPAGTDDDIGQEIDVNFIWTIAKNLKWLWRFGYWDTGDFWKGAEGITNLDDTFTVFHKLALKF